MSVTRFPGAVLLGGTDKSAAFDELAPTTGLGDIIIRGAAGTNQRLAPGAAGKALVSTLGIGNGVGYDYPQGPVERFSGVTASGAVAATYNRMLFANAASGLLTSGTLRLTAIALPGNTQFTKITFYSVAATVGPTAQWFGLFDSAGNQIGLTTDDGATAWGAATVKGLPFATTTVTGVAGIYFVGICVVAGTPPTLASISGLETTVLRQLAPKASMNSSAGLTTPASCPNPVTLGAAGGAQLYAEIT